MNDDLKQWVADLDRDGLRVSRPDRFVFFCGGKIGPKPKEAVSLRHYLLEEKSVARRVRAAVILADRANQLYRDTDYKDLISFEEDIALLSASVLIITESAGSLAELGAFVANAVTRPAVAVISQTLFSNAESFVRFGPIERVKKANEERVAFIPWRTNKSDHVVKASVSSHVTSIVDFINDVVNATPREESYASINATLRRCVNVLWLLHLANALSITQVVEYYQFAFQEDISRSEVNNMLYCMKLAGWVERYEYINKSYWYAVYRDDPISKYRFKPGVKDVDSLRRKSIVTPKLKAELSHPSHVLKFVQEHKVSARVIT